MNWNEKRILINELLIEKANLRIMRNHYYALSSVNSNYSPIAKNVFEKRSEELDKQIKEIEQKIKELNL